MVLDKLKIGNTEMKIHEPELFQRQTTGQKITSANTWTTLNTFTITKKGVYTVQGDISFASASSTGATKHATRFLINGTDGGFVSASRVDADNGNVSTTINGARIVDTVPYEIALQGFCSKTIATGFETTIKCFKIYDLGD